MINKVRCLSSSREVFILLALSVMTTAAAYGRTFSFAVIADPHISGNPGQNAKLKTAIDWIIGNRDGENIELVFVVGDIGWGGPRARRNLKQAKEMLDRLDGAGIAYVPVIGDNEIQCGSEREFAQTFDSHYRRLSKSLPAWRKAPAPVNGKYLQNFSFDYKGCHFVCSDFNSRQRGNEGGELHDFAGGSWPWFKNDIETCPKNKKESIVIFTHIGMFRTGFGKADQYLFSPDEMKKIKGFLHGYRDYVDSNYAGHIHQNWHASVWTGLFTTIYHVRTTDETWYCRQWPEVADRSITVRLVEVDSDGTRVSYKQHVRNALDP
ncbi:MAG: metallophosphoesterase family protein [Planctomycetota bacterium]|jgi:hypothetical protein